ncbi:MAG: helix-turn-helix domain-containing protein [Anaerolineales bacterium]|jgi:transcriptional regulator with XRE-family HTH domain
MDCVLAYAWKYDILACMNDKQVDLTQLRKQKNLSQADLAEMAGVSQATISRFEKGESQPSLQVLAKIARALNMDVREIIPQERLDQIFGFEPLEKFYAFCPNPLCPRNEYGRDSEGTDYIRWRSGSTYSIDRYQEVNFCPRCGTDLVKECKSCGKLLELEASRYCISCGKELTNRPTKEEWKKITELNTRSAPSSEDEIPF